MLVYFLQLLAIVVDAATFVYVGDNSKGLRGHHLLHQKLYGTKVQFSLLLSRKFVQVFIKYLNQKR